MKTFYKITATIILLILLNLVMRILSDRYNTNLLLVFCYTISSLGFVIFGMNWITQTIGYKKEYLKSAITVFFILLITIISSDLIHQFLYQDYVFTPRIFAAWGLFIYTIIPLILISLIIAIFYSNKKIKFRRNKRI